MYCLLDSITMSIARNAMNDMSEANANDMLRNKND